MNTEQPVKRRISRATWIGLGMTVGLGVALAWLLGWGADPAPPVPQVAGVPMSDLYPEWVRPGGGALPLPPMLNGFGGPNFAQAEQVPWMLWRARQEGSPLHQMMRKMGPRMPAAIQSRLPMALDPEDVRTRIAMDLEMGIANRGLDYSDILREVIRVSHPGQRALAGVLRYMEPRRMQFLTQVSDESPELLLRLAREGDPEIRVVAGIQLLEGHAKVFGGTADALQPVLVQLAKDRAGQLADWSHLTRLSVTIRAGSFAPGSATPEAFEPIAPGWRGSAYPGFGLFEKTHPEGGAEISPFCNPSRVVGSFRGFPGVSLRDPVLATVFNASGVRAGAPRTE